MEIKFVIPEETVQAAIKDLEMYVGPLGIVVTEDHLKTIFESNPWLLGGLGEGGFDTMEREYALSDFCRLILDVRDAWPSYCDANELNFYAKLINSAKEKGLYIKKAI